MARSILILVLAFVPTLLLVGSWWFTKAVNPWLLAMWVIAMFMAIAFSGVDGNE